MQQLLTVFLNVQISSLVFQMTEIETLTGDGVVQNKGDRPSDEHRRGEEHV